MLVPDPDLDFLPIPDQGFKRHQNPDPTTINNIPTNRLGTGTRTGRNRQIGRALDSEPVPTVYTVTVQ
jgi:hypothetical protein